MTTSRAPARANLPAVLAATRASGMPLTGHRIVIFGMGRPGQQRSDLPGPGPRRDRCPARDRRDTAGGRPRGRRPGGHLDPRRSAAAAGGGPAGNVGRGGCRGCQGRRGGRRGVCHAGRRPRRPGEGADVGTPLPSSREPEACGPAPRSTASPKLPDHGSGHQRETAATTAPPGNTRRARQRSKQAARRRRGAKSAGSGHWQIALLAGPGWPGNLRASPGHLTGVIRG